MARANIEGRLIFHKREDGPTIKLRTRREHAQRSFSTRNITWRGDGILILEICWSSIGCEANCKSPNCVVPGL